MTPDDRFLMVMEVLLRQEQAVLYVAAATAAVAASVLVVALVLGRILRFLRSFDEPA